MGIVWDSDTREALRVREGRIRDDRMYVTAGLLAWMEAEWGGVLTHVKTSTDRATGEVSVFRARHGEPGAVALCRIGAGNAGEIAFWRPLRKLGLTLPPDRQFNVTPFTREVAGVGTLFVFPLRDRVSVPRKRKGAGNPKVAEGQGL
ncbi:MAG: hypothetical protein ACOY94_04050 [Bacillota bacterium]